MKKILLGLMIGIGLMSAGFALAREVIAPSWYVTDKLDAEYNVYQKTYDENTNVVCYAVNGGNGVVAISCLKNN